MPRDMINGDFVIPFSMAFVIKKMEKFDCDKCDIYLTLTMIVRLKFTGLDYMDEIMEYCRDNLKARINEVEELLVDSQSEYQKR